MSRPALTTMAAVALIALAACSPGAEPSGSTAAAATCSESTAAGAVAVTIINFAFQPVDISAKPNEVIGFTNTGSAPHTATLDEGDCKTPTLNGGDSGGLTFSAAGTYPFHCSIHPAMKGTIVIN